MNSPSNSVLANSPFVPSVQSDNIRPVFRVQPVQQFQQTLSPLGPTNLPPLEPGPVIPKWNDPFNDVTVAPDTEHHSYYRYNYNNHDVYTNYKILRFRDMLYSDKYPISQSDIYVNYKYVPITRK